MSEKQNRPFRLSFNPSLQGDFYGLRVTQTVVCCRCAICSGV
jgi:hypothetical protein